MEALRVLDFSWDALPRLTQDDVAAAREARGRLLHYFDLRRAVEIVRELFACELQGYGTASGTLAAGPVSTLGADIQLASDELDLNVSLEPALVSLLLNRLLGREAGVTSDKPLAPATNAAFRAVAAELCRKLARTAPLAPVTTRPSGEAWRSDFWVRLDGVSYRGRVTVGLRASPLPARAPEAGAVRIAVPVVLLEQSLSPAELAGIEIGDAVVFDAPGELAAALKGGKQVVPASLCSPVGTFGVRVDITEAGLVLRAPTQLGFEVGAQAAADATNSQAADVVLDAPQLVRLEVGEVTLPAHDWLGRNAGDVLPIDVPLGDSVVLRVAGRGVARGTLIDVEGRLGVRVVAMASA